MQSEVDDHQKAKANYNASHCAQELPELSPGDRVHIRDLKREGVVNKEVSTRSYLIDTPQGKIRRNRSALIDEDQPVTTRGAEEHGYKSQSPNASLNSLPMRADTNGTEVHGHKLQAIKASQLSESQTGSTNGAEGPTKPTNCLLLRNIVTLREIENHQYT